MATNIESVKVWINAFIPRDIQDYTRVVPAGPHAGETMIPGPTPISDCYLTDQRSFDEDIHASSRMHSEVRVDFTSSPPTVTQWHYCNQTTELDCEDGDVEATGFGDTSRMSFHLVPNPPGVDPDSGSQTPPRSTDELVRLEVSCSASNPCAPSARLFGDIDFRGVLEIDTAARTVRFVGRIDEFPAFEAYATINDGAGCPLFQLPPPPGNTVGNLPGDADREIAFAIRDSDGDGVFDTELEP